MKLDINVSSRILRHISRGIYRSPAGALKELVSNAYDAGARKVTINTNFPALGKISVTDNGCGMSKKRFEQIIGQIGFSDKNLGEDIAVIGSSKKTHRKVIGHYGIGFLAIAQLTDQAEIVSKESGTSKGIKITIDFEQFERHNNGSSIVDEAKIEKNDKRKQGGVKIGECELEEVEFPTNANAESFTKIELTSIRPDVKKKLKGDDISELYAEAESQRPYSSNFEQIIQLLIKKENATTQSGTMWVKEYSYEKLLWELAVYSPLQYPSHDVFKKGNDLHHFATLANNFDFELVVDGFFLKKPYYKAFWESKKDFKPIVFKWEDEKYKDDYAVSAYLVFQPGTMIRPKSMQGILIRENGVAVGMYDLTYMSYPFFQGSKYSNLTGEIFTTGLSGAMNVDRDSFNETDDYYVALKQWFHKKLYGEVFKKIAEFNVGKESPTQQKNLDLVLNVLNLIAHSNGEISKVEIKNLGKQEKRRMIVNKKTLVINSDHKDCRMNSANREKLLLSCSLIIHGHISPSIIDETFNEVARTKRAVKRNESR